MQEQNLKAGWSGSWETSYWIDGQEEKGVEYGANWYASDEKNSYDFSINLLVFNNEKVDLDNYLKNDNSFSTYCKEEVLMGANYKENKVYICNWDFLRNEQNLEDYAYKSRQLVWFNKNMLIRMYVYSGRQLTDEEMMKLAAKKMSDFVNDLKDNQYNYQSWEYFGLGWPLSRVTELVLGDCSSQVPIGECIPQWSCKIEPVICPEYGYQTRTCVDYNCGSEKKQEQLYCSPGICSGCYVPRWFGYFDQSNDNICIPYGNRFSQQRSPDYTDEIYEGEFSEGGFGWSLTILSSEEAVLKMWSDTDSRIYDLVPGNVVY